MKILRFYQIYMKIKDIRMPALCLRFVVFLSRSTVYSTPELFFFAHDGAKGLGSRMAVPQTKWKEEKTLGWRVAFCLQIYSERY